jgi:thiamine-phosphate pyrophosphorylase
MPSRKLELPRVYPITDRTISGLTHQNQVKAFIGGGARLIQIRDKTASSRDLFDSVKQCLEITKENNAKLIVNDRVDIALLLKACGVHLGQDDLPPAEARKLLGDDAIIGFSTHSLEQARDAMDQPIDYLAFGPVFPTGTKADHDPVVGLDMLKRVRDVVKDLPLVAIGGIDPGNLELVLNAGADSAAMISALVAEPEKIAENTQKALKMGDSLR